MEIVKFTGPVKWCKLSPPGNVEYEKYTVNMYLDKEGLETYKRLKMKMTLRSDEDGQYITLARPFSVTLGDETVALSAPQAFTTDGNLIEGDLPQIGNGSILTLKVAVYPTRKGNGHRIEAYRIDVLKEYNPTKELAEKLRTKEFEEVPF